MNTNVINVQKYPISQILSSEDSKKAFYEIPKYQREYTWTKKNWEDLFDDLIEHDDGYFLGSIICINKTTDFINDSLRFEVVDGQQRITTISILLTAMCAYLTQHYTSLDDEQRSDLLQLKKKLVDKNEATNDGIRVVPQRQNSNLEDYMSLLSDNGLIAKRITPKKATTRKIYRAFAYFTQRINDTIEEKNNQPITTVFKILEKVNSAILVKIDVANYSDAYTLFESLNKRGTPLTAVDLIKNSLFAKLDLKDEHSLDYCFERWKEVLDNLGEDYVSQERFFRQNYNAFKKSINEPFVTDASKPYPLGIATRTNLLEIYEKIISKNPQGLLDELIENSAIYAKITLTDSDKTLTELEKCFLDLQRIQGAPAYLLLLYLLKNQGTLQLTDKDLIKIITLLINFFVRRNLTDVPPTRDLIRLFISFVEEIEANGYKGEQIYTNLRTLLISKLSADEELSFDRKFEQSLSGSVYEQNRDATRFILCALAEKGMTKETFQDLWAKNEKDQYIWTIEHIFPQGSNIPDCWVKMIADGDKDKAKDYQSEYVHTLGNLTITGYNSTLGNKSFEYKRDRQDSQKRYIGYKNGLNLNKDVCNQETWNTDIIKERTKRLVEEITNLFKI